MKRFLHHSLGILALSTVCSAANATQYCQTPLTNGENTIYVSTEKIGDNLYQLKVEGENLNGFGGTHCHINENVGYHISTNLTIADDKKSMTAVIESTTEPSFYTPLYVMMPGEINFGDLKDITWGTCGSAIVDEEAPVMGEATLESVSYNNAVIVVSATDNITDPVTRFSVSDEANAFETQCYATDGKITVKGLTTNTSYNFTIKAVDNAGNTSANSVSVEATTTERVSEASGSRLHFDGVTGTAANFNIDYADNTVTITLTSSDPALPIDYAHATINGAGTPAFDISEEGVATHTISNVEPGTTFAIAFLYSVKDFEGNWQTAESFSDSDKNIIFYIATPKGDSTAIDNIDAVNAKVYSANGAIVVEGAEEAIAVYNITGQQVAIIANPSVRETIALSKGLYIVKIGNSSTITHVK